MKNIQQFKIKIIFYQKEKDSECMEVLTLYKEKLILLIKHKIILKTLFQ